MTRQTLPALAVMVAAVLTLTGCASSAHAPVSGTEVPTAAASVATPAADRTLETPVSLGPARVVYHGSTDRRVVALTFDAGADTGFTGDILETLRREGVRATFSIAGLWAERNRDLLLAITADGHALINHSYDHASFTGLSTAKPPLTPEERALELSRTETTIYHLSQRTTRPYFRPPFGDVDGSVQTDAGAAGYGTIVMWTVDSQGWNHATANQIVERCLAQASPGAIYVMHVGSESQDAAALPRVIEGLRAAGYSFGTIEEVLG